MIDWINLLGWVGFVLLFAGAIIFGVTSLIEKRKRASFIAVLLFTPLLGLYAVLLLLDFSFHSSILLGMLILGGIFFCLIILPIGKKSQMRIIGNQERVDERDALFHRFYRIQSGILQFDAYYRDHPDKFDIDEKIRSLPLLGHPGSSSYHPLSSLFFRATFDILERMTLDVEWDAESVEQQPIPVSPEELSKRIRGFARYLGADLIGFTKLNPAYIYSHIGRSPGEWGSPITLNHRYAIAICVEMDHKMIRHAPDSTVTTETSFKYFEAAKIAMILARYINLLGYEARAHVDANYRVMCVPIAVDAGLGELGRLGLLITPEFGPRVRISVVTTNLPLPVDNPICFGVQNFCDLCKKCATNCPSGAIESGHKSIYKGVEKWQSIQESCYRFWRLQGSDCGICIKVCPYSHPRSPLHDLVRWTIRRNHLARRLALLGDDLFYGRHPDERFSLPDWHNSG